MCATLPGCALAIDGPAPDRPRNEVPKCDTGKGLVAADGLWATLAGVGSLAAFADDETGTGIALGAISALFIASAVKGSGAADSCRSAYEEFNVATYRDQQEIMARRPTAPRRTVEAKPRKKPKPVEPQPEQIDPSETVDPPAETPPEPSSEYATPRPPTAKPPVKQQATAPEPVKPPVKPTAEPAKQKTQPKIPSPKKAAEEEWGDFWKEVP